MFPTKVLLATDGSPDSIRATRMAIQLSNSLDSELHVVHVGLMPNATDPEVAILDSKVRVALRERTEHHTREKLEEQLKKIKRAGGRVVKAHARVGRPDAEILSLAEELGAGLIILGSRGLAPLKRALMGSVSNSVVRHAHTSVLIMRGHGSSEERDYLPGRILLAFDGSRDAEAAARAASEMSDATGSEIHVLCILQTPYLGPFTWEVNVEKVKHEARSFVDWQAERIGAEGGKVKDVHLATGKPAKEIMHFAEKLGVGLVVMGSRGLNELQRVLMGSVSESVVRYAHCPVLMVREEKVSQPSAAQIWTAEKNAG